MVQAHLMPVLDNRGSDFYQELFNLGPIPMWVIDPRTLSFLAVNQAAIELYGFTESEFLEMTIMQIRPPDEIPRLLDKLTQTQSISGEQGIWTHKKKDETLLHVKITARDVLFQGRKAVLSVMVDITDRIQANAERSNPDQDVSNPEAERRKLEERYRTLFEESKDVIFMSTPDGRFLDINPAGVELLGYSSQSELMRVNIIRDIFADVAERESYLREVHEKGFVKDHQLHLKRKDGTILTVLETSVAVRNAGFEIVAYRGIMRDITKERELQKQLFQAQKIETIGKLAGVVAHDFNNILMAISGYCELLELELQTSESHLKLLHEIKKSTSKGSTLTRQLLAFSRNQVLEPRTINLNDHLGNMEPMLKRLLGDEISLDYRPGKNTGNVKVDPTQMEQVILNLVVNARDAMPSGGTLRIETSVENLDDHFVNDHIGAHGGRHVKLSFADNGVGMSESTISHIFEPFFTTKQKGKGTGLGLSSVYGIVRQSGGYITVESTLLKGTTFHIYLPQVAEPAFISGTFKRNERSGSETILLVDDNDSVREPVSAILQLTGYEVLCASSGSEALDLSRKHARKIHILITDVAMPQMNGWQLAETLKVERPYLKVLFMSGYAEHAHSSAAAQRSKNFIEKPASREALLSKIREILDGPNSQR